MSFADIVVGHPTSCTFATVPSSEKKQQEQKGLYFLKVSCFEVKLLKFLAFLGGFPLAVFKEESENSCCSYVRFATCKVTLTLAILVLLVPSKFRKFFKHVPFLKKLATLIS